MGHIYIDINHINIEEYTLAALRTVFDTKRTIRTAYRSSRAMINYPETQDSINHVMLSGEGAYHTSERAKIGI